MKTAVSAVRTSSHPAALSSARRLFAIVLAVSILMLSGIGIDLLRRNSVSGDPAVVWMRFFSFSTPALRPAGTPLRHPETVHPAVDLRFAAGLERIW